MWLSCARLLATPWTVAHQAALSMELSRQECWNGLPFPSLGDLPNPGIESVSPVSHELAGGFFTTSATRREGNGTPLQYFCLENPMEGGAW